VLATFRGTIPQGASAVTLLNPTPSPPPARDVTDVHVEVTAGRGR
jgi:hypothetical protein